MAISSPFYRAQPPTDDWRLNMERARGQAYGDADPRMVVEPFADPGYRMPNTGEHNLPQNVGNNVSGWLPAGGGPNALLHPSLLRLLQQRPDLMPYFMQHNQLMPPP